MGKSVTQTGLNSPVLERPSTLPISTRNAPRAIRVISFSSPMMKIISPSFIPVALVNSFCKSSLKNLEIPPISSPFSSFIHANPFALYFFTKSVKPSIFLREYFAPPGITNPLTISADLNALKSDWSVNGFTSWRKRSKRVSGLSEPYVSMASSQVRRGNDLGNFAPITSLNMLQVKPSIWA